MTVDQDCMLNYYLSKMCPIIAMLFIVFVIDDMMIKLWDWENHWHCSQVFEGHTHYVMMIVLNPKDHNQFASASLDRTIKVRTVACFDYVPHTTHSLECRYGN